MHSAYWVKYLYFLIYPHKSWLLSGNAISILIFVFRVININFNDGVTSLITIQIMRICTHSSLSFDNLITFCYVFLWYISICKKIFFTTNIFKQIILFSFNEILQGSLVIDDWHRIWVILFYFLHWTTRLKAQITYLFISSKKY